MRRAVVRKHWADAYRCTLEGVGTVYVKRYFPQRNRLLGVFRENLAVREYRCSRVLAALGIPQAEPVLAAVTVNRWGLVTCGLYMMREVEKAVSLDKLLEQMQHLPEPERLAAIADELFRLLEILHEAGFVTGGFQPRNLSGFSERGSIVITPFEGRWGKR
jgi:hypothetical protein